MANQTTVDRKGDDFLINGNLTFQGRHFRGHRIEGLLPNARLIQGIFDDLNPATRFRWDYPDGPWDADRNTDAFVAAMPEWRSRGLLAFTIGLQGGSPEGYSGQQPWHNSAFDADGTFRADYATRLARILDAADQLGMVVILSLFYFGQDQHLQDEGAVRQAVHNTVDWICERGDKHIIIEIANETDHRKYDHECFQSDRVQELITLAQNASSGRVANRVGRLYVGVSFCGGALPSSQVVETSDLILLHGNDVHQPDNIRHMVQQVRAMQEYKDQPIVFNEDDHFDFDQPDNNFLAATTAHASWGYFDYRMRHETDFKEGYQSMPCDWGIVSKRKRGFFALLAEMTGMPHSS